MKLVVFGPEAQEELADAIAYYDNKRKGLGKRFGLAVLRTLGKIGQSPRSRAIVRADVRQWRVRGYPHSIIYREAVAGVQVVSVFHLRRDPGVWQARI